MRDDDRLHVIICMLHDYSSRPPLKFPSEAEIPKIARKILDIACGPKSLWTKWDKEREEIVGRAVDVWVPLEDLLKALNVLPGEKLTITDVEQRLYALRNEYSGYSRAPDEAIKEASFAVYAEEKSKGTEFIAILGWLEEWTLGAEERLRRQRAAEHRERIAQEKRRAEARLRSGADCPWTVVAGVVDSHCRKAGRLFRLKPLAKDSSPLARKFEVLEVKTLEEKRGVSVGLYRTRGEASKAVLEVAYKPEWS